MKASLKAERNLPIDGEVWYAMLDAPWLRAVLARLAERLAASHHLGPQASDDVVQQVLAMLTAKRAANQVMHAKPEKFPESFSAWIGKILRNACSEAARFLGFYHKPGEALRDVKTYEEDFAGLDRRWDIAKAAARLKGRQRSVIMLLLQGLEQKEIAESLGLTYKQVIYAIQKARPKLQQWLADYDKKKKRRPK